MSLDTKKIENYVKNNAEIFIKQVLFQFVSGQYMNVRPGIKNRETFGRIATDVLFQAAGCGHNPKGVTQLDDIELSVERFKINENICDDDLVDTYYGLLGAAGSLPDGEEFVLENEYIEAKIAKVQDALEKLVWQGDKALGVDNVNGQFDGILKKIAEGAADSRTGGIVSVEDVANQPYVKVTIDSSILLENGQVVTISGTTSYNGNFKVHNFCKEETTSSFYINAPFVADETGTWLEVQDSVLAKTTSVCADLEAMEDSLPDEFHGLPDKILYLEPKDFRSLQRELIAVKGTGNFHIDMTDKMDSFIYPGTDIRVVRIPGLSGSGARILTFKDNLWFGTDLVNDWEEIRFFYDEGDDVHKFRMKMKGGTQIAQRQYLAIAQ